MRIGGEESDRGGDGRLPPLPRQLLLVLADLLAQVANAVLQPLRLRLEGGAGGPCPGVLCRLVGLDARLKGVDDAVPFVPDAETLRRVEVLTLETAAGELDVLARPSRAPRYDVLRRRADRYDLGGFSVLVASVDDLIAMKQAANRRKDQADVEELEAIRRLRRR